MLRDVLKVKKFVVDKKECKMSDCFRLQSIQSWKQIFSRDISYSISKAITHGKNNTRIILSYIDFFAV